MTKISGFSKLSKQEKITWLTQHFFDNAQKASELLELYWNSDKKLQQLHDEFSENTISNFYLPFGVAPNFTINDKVYTIPMTIEESSVIAAASKAAKFWNDKGGFKTKVLNTQKVGQVHFTYEGDFSALTDFFNKNKKQLFEETKSITANMEKRGGGILDMELRNKTADLKDYYQIHCTFETLDAMGANFINSCLEQIAGTFKKLAEDQLKQPQPQVIMSILSNYVPNCVAWAEVSCPVNELATNPEDAALFAEKFLEAVKIAQIEPYRAVTHNKGIMNGIDAVILATGNDFRAVEAGVHAYAARNGKYSSLTNASIKNGIFKFWIEVPLALGTVGGLTSLHPMVKLALEMLGKPSAKELMQIVAVAGLAQNFAAVKSLVTTGIQEGHMKMHLMNILNQFQATNTEKEQVIAHFKSNVVSHSSVVKVLENIRNAQ